jgi:hypothetical protein
MWQEKFGETGGGYAKIVVGRVRLLGMESGLIVIRQAR